MTNTTKPVLLLGVGNILLSDEGVGVHVIKKMQNLPPMEGVEIVDGGTSGADLLDIISDRQKVIIIDAMTSGEKPGTVLKFSGDSLVRDKNPSMSLHDVGIFDTLHMAKMIGSAPREVVVFGIEPASLDFAMELSSTLQKIVPSLIEAVLQEIKTQ